MRVFMLLFLGLLASSALAQTPLRKSDVIEQKNGVRTTGYVVKVSADRVYYRTSLAAKAATFTLPRAQVKLIRYGSGKVQRMASSSTQPKATEQASRPVPPASRSEQVTAPPPATPTTVVDTVRQAVVGPTGGEATTGIMASASSVTSVNQPTRSSYRYTTITIGADGLYVLPSLSPQWTDDILGLGIREGVGGSIAVTLRINRWVGFSIQAGYNQWQVQRNFALDGTVQYVENEKLLRIPVQAGLRLYVLKNLYVQPQISAEWFSLTSTTSENHPAASFSQRQQTLTWGYGGQVGYQFRYRRLVTDVGISYSVVRGSSKPLIWYFPITNPLHLVGLRLGVGYVFSN